MCSAVSSNPLPQRMQSGKSAKPASKVQPARGNAFRASQHVSENSGLFKKFKPDSPFLWERISSLDKPTRSSSGSETEPSTRSRYRSFRDREKSLDQGSGKRSRGRLRSQYLHPALQRQAHLKPCTPFRFNL